MKPQAASQTEDWREAQRVGSQIRNSKSAIARRVVGMEALARPPPFGLRRRLGLASAPPIRNPKSAIRNRQAGWARGGNSDRIPGFRGGWTLHAERPARAGVAVGL